MSIRQAQLSDAGDIAQAQVASWQSAHAGRLLVTNWHSNHFHGFLIRVSGSIGLYWRCGDLSPSSLLLVDRTGPNKWQMGRSYQF